MIKYCKDKWEANKDALIEALRNDKKLYCCDYDYLVEQVVTHILNRGCGDGFDEYDIEKITRIDNGDYQGTLLYLIPRATYQPSEGEYLMTYVGYGSCSGCDTLQRIQSDIDYDQTPNEKALSNFVMLCLHLVQNMIRPYNTGWWNVEDFEPCEF